MRSPNFVNFFDIPILFSLKNMNQINADDTTYEMVTPNILPIYLSLLGNFIINNNEIATDKIEYNNETTKFNVALFSYVKAN